MSDDLNELISYISENVNELKHKDRVEVMQMILSSQIEKTKITEKGAGTQIKFVDIPKPVIYKLHNFIKNKIENDSNSILSLENLLL